MDAAQAILKKTPPADLGKNLQGISQILSKDRSVAATAAASEDALLWNKNIFFPLQIWEEVVTKDKPFILCKYNRVGERHRSPWSNKLYPGVGGEAFCAHDVIEDEELHVLEAKINSVWEAYKNLYYGHDSVGSVYLQDRAGEKAKKGAFVGFFGVHKTCSAGTWNSVHIVHVDEPTDKTCTYRVESSIMMVVTPTEGETATQVDLSATLSKEANKTCKVTPSQMTACHIENIGTLIEANEIELRSSMERVYVPKTQDIMNDIKKVEPKMPTQANPLMGIMMGSDVLKKKLASG